MTTTHWHVWIFLCFNVVAHASVIQESVLTYQGNWQENVELRFHRVCIYTNDMEGSKELWTNVMGYRTIFEETTKMSDDTVPCAYSKRVLLQRGTQDGVLLTCFTGCVDRGDWEEPHSGITAIGYVVNNLKEFALQVGMEGEMQEVDGILSHNGFDELCYRTTESVTLCVWEWVHGVTKQGPLCTGATCQSVID